MDKELHLHKTVGNWKFTDFNSYPPSAAYMRRWTESAWVQIIAFHLADAKSLWKPHNADILSIVPQGTYFNEILFEILFFIQENALEHVVFEKAAILSRSRLINGSLFKLLLL